MLRIKIEYSEGYLASPSVETAGRRKNLDPVGGPGNFREASPPARLAEFESLQGVARPTVMMHP